MRVYVLGSGTLLPDPARGCAAHWIEGAGFRLLLDCGPGSVRTAARLGLSWYALSHLFVSHFHTDHVGDLAYLLFALKHGRPSPRREGLTLLGPRGLQDHLAALARAHGPHILDPGFSLTVRELDGGESWDGPKGGFRILTRVTPHTHNSLAVKVETEDGAVGYTGDTGPSPELAPFFEGCQILIAECGHPEEAGTDTHLTPEGLADLAVGSSPGVLVPVHSYPPLDPRTVPLLIRSAGFDGQVLTGRDGLGLHLVGGVVKILRTETQ